MSSFIHNLMPPLCPPDASVNLTVEAVVFETSLHLITGILGFPHPRVLPFSNNPNNDIPIVRSNLG